MSEVRFSAAAESDLLDIIDFIARDNPRAAREWLAAVRERCAKWGQKGAHLLVRGSIMPLGHEEQLDQ